MHPKINFTYSFSIFKICKYFFAFLLLSCNSPKDTSLQFSKSISPIVFNLQKDTLQNKDTGERLVNAKSCQTCHKEVYENWFNSRHRVAFTNELYHDSHEREPMTWCINCHAPFINKGDNIDNPNLRLQKEDGISCNVCHVREGKVLVSKLPSINQNRKSLLHDYKINTEMDKSALCANCHQFNFPTILSSKDKSKFAYSHLPMQNTVGEFEDSYFKLYGECQSCHLERDTSRTHKFSGGHDKERLADSIFITGEKIGTHTVLLSVLSVGIGHSFPTGDLFRALKIKIKDSKTKLLLAELILKKDYQLTQMSTNARTDSPAMHLVSDTTIPPATNDNASSKTFTIQISDKVMLLEAELYMDYLHGINRTQTKIPIENTILPFKKVKIELKESDSHG